MPRYRMLFEKKGYIKFTSHLDMIRLFERAIKRCGVLLDYSQGFNPHPKIFFAQPLSLGYESNGEMIEIDTKGKYVADELKEKIENEMPKGVSLISCEEVPMQKKTAASLCYAAKYKITIEDHDGKLTVEGINEMLERSEIMVTKKTKKNIREIDIRHMIREYDVDRVDDNIILETILDAGGESNLSPQLLIKAVADHFDILIGSDKVDIVREKLYL